MIDIWHSINLTLKRDFDGYKKIFLRSRRSVAQSIISYLHMTNPKRSQMNTVPMIFTFMEEIALMQ